MPELNVKPTVFDLIKYRSDIGNYLGNGQTLDEFMDVAVLEVKRYLEDRRNILWAQVYDITNDEYFVDTDDNERNKDRIQYAIIIYTVALIFKDYSITHGGSWWELYLAYRAEAEDKLSNARLDVDLDEDGDITGDEEALFGQAFFVR